MKTQILIAGHGGQGILLLGDYVAYAAVLAGMNVAYTPSYGPETRGGKAKCYVVFAAEEVDNPIAEAPDIELIMNQPSMEYVRLLRPGGLLVYNRSLVQDPPGRADIVSYAVPATEIAESLRATHPEFGGDTKMFANSVIYGSYLALCAPEAEEAVDQVLAHFLAGKSDLLTLMNREAISRGLEHARKNPSAAAEEKT